jgi:hypothetical protein
LLRLRLKNLATQCLVWRDQRLSLHKLPAERKIILVACLSIRDQASALNFPSTANCQVLSYPTLLNTHILAIATFHHYLISLQFPNTFKNSVGVSLNLGLKTSYYLQTSQS